MTILGIDPGLANTGWGVVECVSGRCRPVSFGVIRTTKEAELSDRIDAIAREAGKLAEIYGADAAAIEDIFFTQNISSAISVAKVIGAVTREFKSRGMDVQYYNPKQIKLAITGVGNADKNQVQQMVKVLLKLDKPPRPDHAADALADCLTYAALNESRTMSGGILK